MLQTHSQRRKLDTALDVKIDEKLQFSADFPSPPPLIKKLSGVEFGNSVWQSNIQSLVRMTDGRRVTDCWCRVSKRRDVYTNVAENRETKARALFHIEWRIRVSMVGLTLCVRPLSLSFSPSLTLRYLSPSLSLYGIGVRALCLILPETSGKLH